MLLESYCVHLCTLTHGDILVMVVTSERKKAKVLHLVEMTQRVHHWA